MTMPFYEVWGSRSLRVLTDSPGLNPLPSISSIHCIMVFSSDIGVHKCHNWLQSPTRHVGEDRESQYNDILVGKFQSNYYHICDVH